jgi:3-oxoacyl-[acyl-carrier protein] reductase
MPTAHNAFISGAGMNIGRAIAVDLARRGCNVLVNGSSNRVNCEAVAAQEGAWRRGGRADGRRRRGR